MPLCSISNGTTNFKKYKQLFEYQHFLLFSDICGQSSNLYLNVVHFFNTSVNKTSVAPQDCCFLALVSNMCCSIGVTLKVVWAEFSTLSLVVFFMCVITWRIQARPRLELKSHPRFHPVSWSWSVVASGSSTVSTKPN